MTAALNVAYLCRGSGYGHAVRAQLLVNELRKHDDIGDLHLCGCGQAVEYFEKTGQAADDLCLEEGCETLSTAIPVYRAYLQRRPLDLVISDELFLVPAVARSLGLPSVLLTCYLGSDRPVVANIDTLASAARHIFVMDWEVLHERSSVVGERTTYTNPLVGELGPLKTDGASSSRDVVVLMGAPREEVWAPQRFAYQQYLLSTLLDAWKVGQEDADRLVVLLSKRQASNLLRTDIGRLPASVTWVEDPTPKEIDAWILRSSEIFCTPSSVLLKIVKAGLFARVLLPTFEGESEKLVRMLSRLGLIRLDDPGSISFSMAASANLRSTAAKSDRLSWANSRDLADAIVSAGRRGSAHCLP